MQRRAIVPWIASILSLVTGDLLLYYGTLMGFACPGCGLRDPSVWLYAMLPWFGGAASLVLAGLFYRRTSQPMRGALLSISTSVAVGVALIFALFIMFALIAESRQK